MRRIRHSPQWINLRVPLWLHPASQLLQVQSRNLTRKSSLSRKALLQRKSQSQSNEGRPSANHKLHISIRSKHFLHLPLLPLFLPLRLLPPL